MTTNLERIRYELEKAGFTLEEPPINLQKTEDTLEDYAQYIGKCVWDICKLFASQEHSGFSAKITLDLVKRVLIDEQPLTPLTNDPNEWEDISAQEGEEGHFQSKRRFSCFSDDNLKTYYDNEAPENKIVETDENGVSWTTYKKEKKHVSLESRK